MPDPAEHTPIALLPAYWQDSLERARVSPISGGVCNTLYRIETDDAAYALRVNNPQPEHLGIDPQREGRVLDAIASQPWAPEVLYHNNQLMLTRWVEGEPPVGGEMTRLNWLGHALNTVHSQAGPLPRVDIAKQLYTFADRCGAYADATHRHIDRLLADYSKPQHGRALTLCHHDWHPGNLIISRSGWTLLDWEFAGLGDPCLDIGSAINGFTLTSPAVETLSQLTGYSVDELKRASAIMKALEIVWYAANPELKTNALEVLSSWLDGPPEATSID